MFNRVTLNNHDGDVYIETTGEYSEIVLKTPKVRVDGDVYCFDGDEGSQRELMVWTPVWTP